MSHQEWERLFVFPDKKSDTLMILKSFAVNSGHSLLTFGERGGIRTHSYVNRCSSNNAYAPFHSASMCYFCNGAAMHYHETTPTIYLAAYLADRITRGRNLFRTPFSCEHYGRHPKCRMVARQPPTALCSLGLMPIMALPLTELRPSFCRIVRPNLN